MRRHIAIVALALVVGAPALADTTSIAQPFYMSTATTRFHVPEKLLDACTNENSPHSLDACTKIVEHIPASDRSAAGYYLRGTVYATMKRYQEAIADLTAAIAISSNTEFLSMRAYTYYMNGQFDLSATDFAAALALNPYHYGVVSGLASAHFAMGQREQALVEFTRAVTLEPDNHEAYDNRGTVELSLGQSEAAFKDYDLAIAIDPHDSLAFNGRGNANVRLGRLDDALHDFDEALRLKPDYDLALENRALFNIGLGRTQAALADLDHVIAGNSQDGAAWSMRCAARAFAGEELNLGLADCNKAVALQPDKGASYFGRAIVYLKLGAIEEALADSNTACTIDPHNPMLIYIRGIARLRHADKTDGDKDIAAAMASDQRLEAVFARFGLTP